MADNNIADAAAQMFDDTLKHCQAHPELNPNGPAMAAAQGLGGFAQLGITASGNDFSGAQAGLANVQQPGVDGPSL